MLIRVSFKRALNWYDSQHIKTLLIIRKRDPTAKFTIKKGVIVEPK